MTQSELTDQIIKKRTYLCIGLDSDIHRIPRHLQSSSSPIVEFNKAIIEATSDLCVAYKLNIAFYESLGTKGWEALKETVDLIPKNHFIIADAKRGDIGNTSLQYAKTFFETYTFDAVTVAPYMGKDSITPFLGHQGKWVIVLGATSNPGCYDFQMLKTNTGRYFYEEVISKVAEWGNDQELMFVVGATREEQIAEIRSLVPDYFFLVPGVGAQGGNLERISDLGLNKKGGLLVNSSRSIIFAGEGKDFAKESRAKAQAYQQEMDQYLKKKGL